ncbi:RcnB family protein [Rhodoferax ferrireducens]|nr:RcnB family protein [Rhodoferax ferrireducens]WPC65318.1 RcnB family protein [Rhodoferax ferrireducens]
MKSKAAISAIMAVTMSMGGFSFAQGNGNRQDEYRNGQAQRGDQQNGRGQQDRRDHNARRPLHPQYQSHPNDGAHRGERGAGPDHAFYRGERIPAQYRSRQYVVDDWRGHQLSAPPRGYHWVQTGGDYVLVAIATGVILQLLLSN